MHATHGIDVKNVIINAALDQEKLSWRSSSNRYRWESHGGSERREKFLKKKHFISKDSVICENLNVNSET